MGKNRLYLLEEVKEKKLDDEMDDYWKQNGGNEQEKVDEEKKDQEEKKVEDKKDEKKEETK